MGHTSWHPQQTLMTAMFSICLILLLHRSITPAGAATAGVGFSLRMFHHYSPRSPSSNGNLTSRQHLTSLLKYDNFRRGSPLESPMSGAKTTTIRPPVKTVGPLFVVSLSIGTGHGKHTYLLRMDTGSRVSWIQCKPCHPCFHQTEPMFDPRHSNTCSNLSASDPICTPPTYHRANNNCMYDIGYHDGTGVSGVMKRDTFTFESSSRSAITIQNLAFGCTQANNLAYQSPEVAGMLAMALFEGSTINQLFNHIDGKFSYCLFSRGSAEFGYLRFGSDARIPPSASRTSIMVSPESGAYYLNLGMIILNENNALRIPHGAFQRKADWSGGVVIDTGTFATRLIRLAYDVARSALVDYFKHFKLQQVRGRDYGVPLDLCYRMPHGFLRNLPTMTLVFSGAKHRISSEHLFFIREGLYFCWLMLPDDSFTIIGAFQQINTRFVYDLRNKKLWFAPEDCSRDADTT